MKGYEILSWDWFQLKNNFVCPVIKIHPTFELMEVILRNNNKIRIAVHGADARYNGIFYGVVEQPAYSNPQNPILYLVLYSPWQGYPILKGYFSVLGQDDFIPDFIKQLQSEVDECIPCGPYSVSSNKPNMQNYYAKNRGSTNTFYKHLCN